MTLNQRACKTTTPSVLERAFQHNLTPVLSPYPHIVIRNCLPWWFYKELSYYLPSPEVLTQGKELGDNERCDLHTKTSLNIDLPDVWREFISFHTSHTFWTQVTHLFSDVIRIMYPALEWEFGEYDNWTTGVRGKDECILSMECQPGINTPTDTEGRVRGPHLDNPIELYGGLLYMKTPDEPEGGDLDICRLKGKPEFHGKMEISDDQVEVVDTVKYEPNTFVMFINSPISVHSVTTRPATDKYRKLVNITGEIPGRLF